MRGIFHSRGFKVLSDVVSAVLGIIVYSAGAEGDSVFSSLLGCVFTPTQRTLTVTSNNAAASVGRSVGDLESESRELKKGVDAPRAKLVDCCQVEQENDQCRTFLELRNGNKDFMFVSGFVVGRDSNGAFSSLTMDRGSLVGVAAGNPVITESGVMGWVSNVGSTFCQVTTLFSPDTNMAIPDRANRESGVISSNIKPYEQGHAKLGYLSSEIKVRKDDIIITSGFGGIYPKNPPAGKVISVGPEEYSVFYMVVIKPFVDSKIVCDVFVITNSLGRGEVPGSLPEPFGALSGGNMSPSSGITFGDTASGSEATK